jgi:hypothetical protein
MQTREHMGYWLDQYRKIQQLPFRKFFFQLFSCLALFSTDSVGEHRLNVVIYLSTKIPGFLQETCSKFPEASVDLELALEDFSSSSWTFAPLFISLLKCLEDKQGKKLCNLEIQQTITHPGPTYSRLEDLISYFSQFTNTNNDVIPQEWVSFHSNCATLVQVWKFRGNLMEISVGD